MDAYMTEQGDITLAGNGDIAVTQTTWRDYLQQAYLRLMTPVSDFTMYPLLGAELDELIGMPQNQQTGDYGCQLVKQALERDGRFIGVPIDVKAVPVSLQGIRFDVYMTVGSRTQMILSIEQSLGLQ